MSLCVRLSITYRANHSFDPLTLGGVAAEDPRECSVECEFGRMSGSGKLYQPAPNGYCISLKVHYATFLLAVNKSRCKKQ